MATTIPQNPATEAFDWESTDPYRFFAYAFGAPCRERHEWFSQPGAAEALEGLWRHLSKRKFPGFRWFGDFESYEAAYIATFDVGSPEAPVPLFESAHDKSRPAQELVLENTFFYEVLGLRVDAARSVPDHLLTQLEFLSAASFMREQSTGESRRREQIQLERDFLERHLLNWTKRAEQKMGRCPFSPYKVLFSLLTLSLHKRFKSLRA